MTIGGFFIVLFVVIGLYGLFKKDDCTITEEQYRRTVSAGYVERPDRN